MSLPVFVVLFYGVFTLIGGVIGHLKTGSNISLVTGAVSGVLLLVAGGLMYKEVYAGWMIATVMTLLLLGFFCFRYFTLYTIWPAGIMACISAAVLTVLLLNR